jgi:hypothetical protein
MPFFFFKGMIFKKKHQWNLEKQKKYNNNERAFFLHTSSEESRYTYKIPWLKIECNSILFSLRIYLF